jgi:hypothetical protein
MTRPHVAVTALITVLALVTFSVTSALSKAPPGQTAPTNSSPPSISGTAAVGNTLQASSGTWSPLNLTYSFQWKRCNNGSCAAIAGATGSSYLIGNSDAGDTMEVSVTASNRHGTATATSAPSGTVPVPSSSGYTNTTIPTISGTAQTGQKLTVSNGSWSPSSSNFDYAWHRCQNGSCVVSPTSADQNSYVVQPGDVGYTIVAQVAPSGDWSESANSNPTAAITGSTPPPPSGTVSFDGSAKNMTTLYSYETTPGDINTLKQAQSPTTWTCLCFLKNDISLVSDGVFGQAYKAAVATGDTNPWNGSSASDGGAQMSIRRSNDLGQWDWYAIAVKVDSWNGPMSDLFFSELASLGYQTSESSQVALGLYGNENNSDKLSFAIDQNAGYADNATGYATGTVHYNTTFMPVVFGQWEEFVIGVKWATDNTGALRVYNRVPGGSWSEVFDRENEATELYGTTPNGTFAADGSNWPTVIDKIGLYFQEYGGESETVYESGLTRSSDLATAESTLP